MFRTAYTYADIGLYPNRLSHLERSPSKEQISTETDFLGLTLSLPIIPAPMRTVLGPKAMTAFGKLGSFSYAPRSEPDLPLISSYKDFYKENTIGYSIGLDYPVEKIKDFIDAGIHDFCIDVANGFHIRVGKKIRELRDQYGKNITICTGNIASCEGYAFLMESGADAVRVGIGGGGACTTSINTGIGVGQAYVLRQIAKYRKTLNRESPILIADGAIKNPGDLAKAIALGADVVMAGSIFAGAEESPSPVVIHRGSKWKQLAGEASFAAKSEATMIEGADFLVPYTKELSKTWKKFQDGLRSSMAYMNASTIEEFRGLPDSCFVILTNGARAERFAHSEV